MIPPNSPGNTPPKPSPGTPGIILLPISQLTENPDNPRLIKDRKFEQLVNSIMEFPQMLYKRPVVVVSTANGLYMAIGGNMRIKAIPIAIRRLKKQAGTFGDNEQAMADNLALLQKGVPCMIADDWTEEQRKEFVIKDNVSFGEHDFDILANQWDPAVITHWGVDIPDIQVPVPDPEEDDFDMPPPENPDTNPGDIYTLNEHKLVCGDCRSFNDVDNLFADEKKANLSFTSPPYWVGKSYETEKSEKDIDKFIENCCLIMAHFTHADKGRVVINTGTSSIHRIEKKRKAEILPLIDKWAKYLKPHGWLLRHLRIWVKRGQLPASISPKTDTIDQHNEFIGTFEKEWSQVLTFWEPNGEQRGQERLGTPWAQQGVWDDVRGEKSASGRHIAAFPVEIPYRNILLYTKTGEIVFDSFGGSGTTMIACDLLGREARLMEISPAYCDVIVERYKEWCQKKGKLCTITKNGELIYEQ